MGFWPMTCIFETETCAKYGVSLKVSPLPIRHVSHDNNMKSCAKRGRSSLVDRGIINVLRHLRMRNEVVVRVPWSLSSKQLDSLKIPCLGLQNLNHTSNRTFSLIFRLNVYCLSALWMHHVVHNCHSIMAPQHTVSDMEIDMFFFKAKN